MLFKIGNSSNVHLFHGGWQGLSRRNFTGSIFLCPLKEFSWSLPEDGSNWTFHFPKANLGLDVWWEFCRLRGLSKWKLDVSQTRHSQPDYERVLYFLEWVLLQALLRITAANPFLIPTENFALLAGLSGQLKRLNMENNWAGSEKQANRRWWVIMLVERQEVSTGIITLQLSPGTIGSQSSCILLPTPSLNRSSVSLIRIVV